MRVFITGGFGFIGGRLGQYLQQAGHQVLLGSRIRRRRPAWLPQCRVAQTPWNDASALSRICAGVDVVVHAAGMNARDCAADPAGALKSNGMATADFVKAAASQNVKRFLYLSTAHVYASPLAGVITEETSPRNPHPYATSHLAGEEAVLDAGQKKRIESVVVRLSNAFGAPAHKDADCWMLLANDLCRQAVQTRKMVLQSSGIQERDFITLQDVCRALEYLAFREESGTSSDILNLGSGVSRSVSDVASLIQKRCQTLLGFSPEVSKHAPAVEEKTEALTFRIDKLRKTGFKISGDFNEEIDRLLMFCQYNVKAGKARFSK